jgi:putative Ca2+/H+ antiporter (TMEM165/GDT1 family)
VEPDEKNKAPGSLGATVAALIPANVISIVAGVAFFFFAIWTWRGDTLGAKDEERASRQTTGSVILQP